MEVRGIVKSVGETENVGKAKPFLKRTLVVTTDEKYPQTLPVEFVQDKTELLDKVSEGDRVEVSINLRGSEYKGKYYPSIQGWRVNVEGTTNSNQQPDREPVVANNDDDLLPF